MSSRDFAKNALELCAPLKFCGPMLRLALRNYSVLLENKIFLVEGKRTCFQLKVGLSTEAASFFCCLASFVSSFASNDMLKRVESEATLQNR